MAAAAASTVAAIVTPAEHRFIVRATYRHLLRAIGDAFDGDHQTKLGAQDYAHRSFREKLPAEHKPGTQFMAARIEHAQGVTQILQENVVQGKLGAKSNYRLKFRETTQRMDNEDTKRFKGTTKSFKDIKAARF